MTTKKYTYDALITELSTTKLTRYNLTTLITKCSQVINDIGIKRMELLEQDADDTLLRKQQAHLIKVRDFIFNVYKDRDSIDFHPCHSNLWQQEGISNYKCSEASELSTWTI